MAVKIYRNAFILLAILFLTELVVSCCKCDTSIFEYKRCSLHVENMQYTDSALRFPPLDTIPAQDYVVGIRLQNDFENLCAQSGSSFLLGAAMACSCNEYNSKALDRIASIRLFAEMKFDSLHPAGSELTFSFNAADMFLDFDHSIHDFIARQNQNLDAGALVYREPSENIYTRLNHAPDSVYQGRFYVEVAFTDGRTYRDTTDIITMR